jgi:hypothetical protein
MPPKSADVPLEFDWSWKLRLFAGAEIVGSTTYKSQQSQAVTPDWAPTFREFFRDFPGAVEKSYAELDAGRAQPRLRLEPWKFLGDEIVFETTLRAHEEVVHHLCAFKNAVRDFPTKWRQKGIPLELKATAWLAGFPVSNAEVTIPSASGQLRDYIGPMMDLGFRLAPFASKQKFVVSAELALMLLDAVDRIEFPRGKLLVIYEGRHLLKGVIANEPYPVLWIDTRDGEQTREEKVLGIRRDDRSNELRDFLREFLDETPRLRRPFIEGDPDPKYGEIPLVLEQLRERMIAEESQRHYRSAIEDVQPKGKPRSLAPPKLPPKKPPGSRG